MLIWATIKLKINQHIYKIEVILTANIYRVYSFSHQINIIYRIQALFYFIQPHAFYSQLIMNLSVMYY